MAGSFKTPFTVDMGGLSRLSRSLKAAAPGLARELRTGLKAGGEIVAAEARSRASWSSRIPGTVRSASAGASVRVSAGGAKAPHAAPFENKGRPGQFRHPVFGNREAWVSQTARPFLGPALEAKETELMAALDAAIDRVIEEGLRG